MGSISSGVGLISGIDTATLIERLLAIEGRGKASIQQRIASLQQQQTAMLDINARLLNMSRAATRLRTDSIFQSARATSSSESVLSGVARAGAQPGTYTFLVDRLVSTSQQLSRGFVDRDSTALGLTDLTFEFGRGQLATTTQLASLNGGEGVRRGKIVITDKSGASATIDLSRAGDVGDVLDAINGAAGLRVRASVSGDRLTIADLSGGGGTLTIADASGYFTATDLGIAGDDGGGTSITGSIINRLAGGASLASLNDGAGVLINGGLNTTDFRITDRAGTVHNIVLGKRTTGSGTENAVTTIQGVIDRINEITGGAVTASIAADGVSLQLADNTGQAGQFIVSGAGTNGERTARDLGLLNAGVASDTIAGRRILAGINSVLTSRLNGGAGLGSAASITLQDRSGANVTVNGLDAYESFADLVSAINAAASGAGVDIELTYNDAGSGLLAKDTSGGSGNLIITGDAAAALGLSTGGGGVASTAVRGTNLQHQYVAGSTRLSELNYGRGIAKGSFRIQDAEGATATVDIDADSVTLQDVIDEINSRGLAITARVNDTGDGLLIESTSAVGTLAIKVESVSGTTARDLNILGSAADGDANNFINGSYERRVSVSATDTLDQVLTKINDAGIPVSASIINTGSGGTPFRLSFTSGIAGARGELSVDAAGAELGVTSLSKGRDARVFFGSSDPASAVLITGASNTLSNVVNKVSIDLKAASEAPVTLSVTRDTEQVVAAVKQLVTTFNDVIGRINEYDKYDPKTERRGVLLGNGTVARVRDAMYRTLQSRPTGVGTQYQSLAQIGIRPGKDGTITLDEGRFRDAYAADPAAVENLLSAYQKSTETETLEGGVSTGNTVETFTSLGVAEKFAQLLTRLTDSVDGTLKTADNGFTRAIELNTRRLEQFDARLDRRRAQLQRQFTAMETALASLQAQQNSLTALQSAVLNASLSGSRR